METSNVAVGSFRSTSIFTAKVMKFIDSDHVQVRVFSFDPRDYRAERDGPWLIPMSTSSFARLDPRDFEIYLRRQIAAFRNVVRAAIWCVRQDN
jgi:hypothetical protein